jgi:hypothetical protein
LRIALHAGPVYRHINPITGHTDYIGTHVSHTARIEPITPPGKSLRLAKRLLRSLHLRVLVTSLAIMSDKRLGLKDTALSRLIMSAVANFNSDHAGIIVCSDDADRNRMATRINEAISVEETLRGKLIRVNRPSG